MTKAPARWTRTYCGDTPEYVNVGLGVIALRIDGGGWTVYRLDADQPLSDEGHYRTDCGDSLLTEWRLADAKLYAEQVIASERADLHTNA